MIPLILSGYIGYILHHEQLICQATTIYVFTEELARSKSATPKHIFGVALSQLLRQWRSWRTGSAAYANSTTTAIKKCTFNKSNTHKHLQLNSCNVHVH